VGTALRKPLRPQSPRPPSCCATATSCLQPAAAAPLRRRGVGDSGGGVSGRGGGGGGRGVGGRGSSRRHTDQPPRLLRLRRPALKPRRHHIGGERQRAGRACSRRSLVGVRRRGAEERRAARRKRIALQRGVSSRAGGGQRRSTPRVSPRAAPCSGAATEICAQVARAGGAACSACV